MEWSKTISICAKILFPSITVSEVSDEEECAEDDVEDEFVTEDVDSNIGDMED